LLADALNVGVSVARRRHGMTDIPAWVNRGIPEDMAEGVKLQQARQS
jgi:hypothetical protein